MSNVQLTAINRTDDKVRSTDELVFESSQSGSTFQGAGDQQEYTVPGQPDEQEHQYSVIGTDLTRQGSTRKEAQNYLYGKFQPTETARHPTIAQQHSSQSVESVESIAKTKTCGCTTGQFCMYFFICIIMLLSIAGITIAVLAWQGVGTDDCSCNSSPQPSSAASTQCNAERIQELQNLLDLINSTNQELRGDLSSAMATISVLMDQLDNLSSANASSLGPRGPPGPVGPRGFNGTRGMQGPSGIMGIQGNNGSNGMPGPPGINGTSINITRANLYANCNALNVTCTQPPGAPGTATADLSCVTEPPLPAPTNIQAFGRRCVASTTGGNDNVATYIRVGNNGEEACVCTVQGTATSVTCTLHRTECPLLQELVIN